MLQGKRSRRIIAATLLTTMLTNTLAPTVSYALTSGPTAPEATSFEPVDTTDMVNVQTGDFMYNIPLMDVPGAEGGYPLSLSYHAGIQPNEDASWVGLGWTLNPGAITRSVNGYPDDWYMPQQSRRDYWSGGQTSTFKVGVTAGLENTPASVGFGLSFSQDTYRGFGVGVFITEGASFKKIIKGGREIGVSPYGEPYMEEGVGLEARLLGLNTSAEFGLHTNFQAISTGFTGRVGMGSALGVSLSSGNSSATVSVGGHSSFIENSNAGKLQTSTSGWSQDVPLPGGFSLSLKSSKTRYWSDETVNVVTHGSLYGSGWTVTDNVAYDNYALLENPSDKNMIDYGDPTVIQGGAYPDFDNYNVSAQGLGGNMRPYLFQSTLVGQNIKDGSTPKVTYFSPGVTGPRPNFRFEGDFSNSYRQDYTPYGDANQNLRTVTPPFTNPTYGNNDGDYGTGYDDGFILAGSRNIDIHLRVRPSNIWGYNKDDRLFDGHMIEGYTMTNESGMSYHFGLPAYSYAEENYQEKIKKDGGLYGSRLTRNAPYAYTWYLTTITGPDYVDRNNNKQADEEDWGYWVNFEYGKWSNKYVWRNPAEGYHRDEDGQFQNCSMGTKEVYYLNAIRTRTHVALFEKDIREDGKGVSPSVYQKNATGNITNADYTYAGKFDENSCQSLQLKRIYLLNAADDGLVSNNSGPTNSYRPVSVQRMGGWEDCELADNVLERYDFDYSGKRGEVEMKALRVIDFEYDYSLCSGTANSFSIEGPVNGKKGKLTLNKIEMRGRGGNGIFPATSFEYDLPAEDQKTATGTLAPNSFVTATDVFNVGDMLNYKAPGDVDRTYCGVVTGKSINGGTVTYQLKNTNLFGTISDAAVFTTKNPDYNKDAYDMWGMFKSDVDVSLLNDNENMGRVTSAISAMGADAWSLRKINTTLGGSVKLNYESDDYNQPVLADEYSFSTISTERVAGNNNQLKITLPDIGVQQYYQVNDQIDLLFLLRSVNPSTVVSDFGCGWTNLSFNNEVYESKNSSNPTVIKEVGTNYLVVENPDYAGFYQGPIPVHNSLDQLVTTNCLKNRSPNACNIKVQNRRLVYGGGLRVKKITTAGANGGTAYSVVYNYSTPDNNAVSSGTTTFEPWVLSNTNIYAVNSSDVDGPKAYRRVLYRNINNVLTMAREIPPPGIMYEYVSLSNEVKNPEETDPVAQEGGTQYQFEVFRNNMIGRTVDAVQSGSNAQGTYYARNSAIKKFAAALGRLKRMVQYDANGKALKEKVNHYLHDGLENLSYDDFMTAYKSRLAQYAYQGYLQERYSEVKEVTNQSNSADNGVKATMSAREEYPCISTGSTEIDYVNGIKVESQIIGYDFYSGAITQTVQTDIYGNRFMTEVIPAYRKYAALGLKGANVNNKNMLTQQAASYTWKMGDNNQKLGLVSANVTTWSDQTPVLYQTYINLVQNNSIDGDIWRMKSTYSWMPTSKTADGITAAGNFTDFNWSAPASSAAPWKKTSEATLYDVNSKMLEQVDMNGNYAATHLAYPALKQVSMTGSPAKYAELAFTGAEEQDELMSDGVVQSEALWVHDAANAHSGDSYWYIPAHEIGIYYTTNTNKLTPGRDYYLGVWVKMTAGVIPNVTLYYNVDNVEKGTASATNSTTKAGDWALATLVIKGSDIVPGKSFAVGCRNDANSIVNVDDMIFRPLNAVSTEYLYDSFSGDLTWMLDQNGMYTKYVYDDAGRLVKTYKEKLSKGGMLVSERVYNYGAPKYGNDPIDADYTRTDCYAYGQVPIPVHVVVPRDKFISYEAPYKANDQARTYAAGLASVGGGCQLPTTIYVKLYHKINSVSTEGCNLTSRGVVSLKFFADPDGVYPLNVTNLSIKLVHRKSTTDGTDDWSTPETILCNGYSVEIVSGIVLELNNTCTGWISHEYYTMSSGTGYTDATDEIYPE